MLSLGQLLGRIFLPLNSLSVTTSCGTTLPVEVKEKKSEDKVLMKEYYTLIRTHISLINKVEKSGE